MKIIAFILFLLPLAGISQSIRFENNSAVPSAGELTNDLTNLANDSMLPKLVFISKISGEDNELNRLYWAMHNASTS